MTDQHEFPDWSVDITEDAKVRRRQIGALYGVHPAPNDSEESYSRRMTRRILLPPTIINGQAVDISNRTPPGHKEMDQTKDRFDTKPHGPSTRFIRFRCECGAENEVGENFAEWSDLGDGDSLHFTCACGRFYKKTGRIPSQEVLAQWYESADD